MLCVLLFFHLTSLTGSQDPLIVPRRYIYPPDETVSVNGSSPVGRCSSHSPSPFGLSSCDAPTSSVLFDGNIPTLTGLDGDMWASQLLALQIHNPEKRDIISDFTTPRYMGVGRVELVMFNCPEWGIAVENITLLTASTIVSSRSVVGTLSPTITSCDSLVRVCISHSTTQLVIALRFIPAPGSNRTYLAEVGLYDDSSTCPTDTIISTPPSHAPDTTTPPPPNTTRPQPVADTTQETASDECHCETPSTSPSCSTSIVLASVITAIVAALLSTVISVLVMIAVCKCHPKFTPGGAETATSAGGEGQEHEELDGIKGGVAVSDPTYMEVGERRGGTTFQLQENEAYASTTHK